MERDQGPNSMSAHGRACLVMAAHALWWSMSSHGGACHLRHFQSHGKICHLMDETGSPSHGSTCLSLANHFISSGYISDSRGVVSIIDDRCGEESLNSIIDYFCRN